MNRFLAAIFLANTFFPLLIVGVLVWGGWQVHSVWVDHLEEPVAALKRHAARPYALAQPYPLRFRPFGMKLEMPKPPVR
ncbi:MAG: hypothetical protein AAF674_00055 [Pseudomonadota bacterium]